MICNAVKSRSANFMETMPLPQAILAKIIRHIAMFFGFMRFHPGH